MMISIITVSSNSEQFINDCIFSINNQTYTNIEHIVIDNASTDRTLELVKKNCKYLSHLVSEADKGIYHAMNKGLNLARGDIIGFLNTDDFYINNMVLSSVIKTFNQNPTIGCCYSDLVYVDRIQTSKIFRYWKTGKFYQGAFLNGWLPPHPTFFVKSSFYKQHGNFDVSYKIAADAELMMRFLEIKKIATKYVPEIWVKFRKGGLSNRSLTNIYKQNYEILKALKKNNLSVNLFNFLFQKLILKSKQFFLRP